MKESHYIKLREALETLLIWFKILNFIHLVNCSTNKPIFVPKIAQFVLNKIFLIQTIIITFIYLLALFTGQNFKKILTANPELWGCIIFGPKWSTCPKQKLFLKKIINIIFIYLLAPFIVQNFKKILTADPELWGCIIFGPKIAHLPKWEFFQKTC